MKRRIFAAVVLVLAVVVSSSGQTAGNNSSPDSSGSQSKLQDKSDWLLLMLSAQGGGGVLSGSGATAFGGGRLGFASVVLNMGYDRIQSHDGFGVDVSGMLPVLRFPGPMKDESKNFFRIYAEPGIGHRSGTGRFGGYFTTKVMVALLSDSRLSGDTWAGSPFVEVERRFPFQAPGQGDTRISFGYMLAISAH